MNLLLFVSIREALYPVDETHSAGRNAMGGSGRMCLVTGCTSGLRGPSPQALTLFGRVGFIARRLSAPFKGNADGVRGIFGNAGREWATALCLAPP